MDLFASEEYVLLQESPAVIVVEVDHGRPFRIGTSGDDLPDISFAAVVDVTVIEHHDVLDPDLRGALAELVATDCAAGDLQRTIDAAMKVLEEWGFGQDFVFSMPRLEEAVYETMRAVRDDEGAYEAEAVMVIGPPGTLARSKAALGLD